MQYDPAYPWHHAAPDVIAQQLGVSIDRGLSAEERDRRRARFGPNTLTVRKGHSALVRFLLQFHQPLVYILLAATVVSAYVKGPVDALVIFAVVLANAVIGFVQESKAISAIDALARTLQSEATVLQDGARVRLPASQLVPGDIVLLQSGDQVPAELRLCRTRDLQVDESALTGESVPVPKHSEAELAEETLVSDRTNMAFSSTLVTYGTGTGIVVSTGDRTEIGRISQLIATTVLPTTPLTRKIAHFSKMLVFVIIGLAAFTFLFGVFTGRAWEDMFMAAVALAVGAIPEGLPAAVTITLAICVSRMAARHAIIRRLPAVETLGSTTVICSDKTGTLTQNQMTVTEIATAGRRARLTGVGYAPEGEVRDDQDKPLDVRDRPALRECLLAGLLCNDATLRRDESGWRVEGDPTEGALLVAAAKAGLTRAPLAAAWPRVDMLPFESEHQYMATLHRAADGNERCIYLKGAVEAVTSRCAAAMTDTGGTTDLDTAAVQRTAEGLAAKGLRVLAFARRAARADQSGLSHDDVAEGLVFLGLQGMVDPPRPEAVSAVAACHGAGIEVKMITGDHPATAAAIAAELGLSDKPGRPPPVLTGRELQALSGEELADRVERLHVFARVTPEQKLRLVEAVQSHGHIVAMTGDGVNDAPALRKADIGVAMGIAGTEVAKDAADMVLTDDNFASIEAAVEEGRCVFDNLTKFIVWTLPTNAGEGLVILAAVLLMMDLPILPVQILWINMTTALLLGLMLAFEPREPGLMERPPRDPRVPLLTPVLLLRIATVGVLLFVAALLLFQWQLRQGASQETARTMAVNVFVFGEMFYLFNCRSLTRSMFAIGPFSNPKMLVGVVVMVLLQLLFTYWTPMQTLFHSAPLDAPAWLAIVAVGVAIYLMIELKKRLTRGWLGAELRQRRR
jgi:Ca2+-transporting ATPase